ncbi:hypothetical protein SDC9_86028 [bioreactor metagenome]|uniref:Uncharacterized protein n=1 Tax=bioreactor metagenome TaxID=1076179 RepID=A0A644ZES5_9ZZZZ
MADLSELLGGMLKDPENADKLRRIASMFAGGDESAPFIPAGRENRDGEHGGGDGAETAALLMKVMPLISQYADGDRDPKVQLLYALRPYLTGDRRDRLEDAVMFLKLSRLVGPAKELFE